MEEFLNFLKEKNAALQEQAAALRAGNRGDEAVFSTVRANVYEICATVCAVWVKKGEPAACRKVFGRFQTEWGAALEAARQRDDAKKICVEEAKLDALEEVIARFDAAEGA